MLYRGFIILFLIGLSISSYPQSFQFNENCKEAYTDIMQLDLKAGKEALLAEQEKHPDNLIPVLLQSYSDFLQLYLYQDETAYMRLTDLQDERLDLLKKGDDRSPYFLYAQAQLQLHSASAHLIKHEYLAAFFDIRRAYKLLEKNIATHPDFIPNKKSFATLKATLGFVPGKYRWGLWLFGIEGDLNNGMATLRSLVGKTNKNDLYHKELTYTYVLLLFHLENKKQEAWDIVQQYLLPQDGDPHLAHIAGKIALYSGHNQEAINLLESTESAGIPTTDYLLGVANLNNLSLMAKGHLERYLNQNKNGDLVKSTYHKLAWYYLIQDDEEQYVAYMGKVKKEGNATLSADQQALKEAEDGIIPDADLLRARLLFDGGYYQKALAILEEKEYEQNHLQLELIYRKGRIHHAMTDVRQAERYYLSTIEEGSKQPYFYAANAALNLAQLYEAQGNKAKARVYYQRSLSLDGHEYETSISQKAKAGLERVK